MNEMKEILWMQMLGQGALFLAIPMATCVVALAVNEPNPIHRSRLITRGIGHYLAFLLCGPYFVFLVAMGIPVAVVAMYFGWFSPSPAAMSSSGYYIICLLSGVACSIWFARSEREERSKRG